MLVEADSAPAELSPLTVVLTRDTQFVENETRVAVPPLIDQTE